MEDARVEIITLPAMRVARAWAYGENPEEVAWRNLAQWAAQAHAFTSGARIFGYNNPDPAEGTPNHGYEFNVTVGPEARAAEGITIEELTGGRYASMPARVLTDPWIDIPEAWQRLDKWVNEHGYRMGAHQWLEEHDVEGHLKALWYSIQ